VNSADDRIRRIRPTQAALYREIRLEALQRNPEAFASTFESENAKPLTWFADRLAGAEVLGAFHDAKPFGTAGLLIQQGPKEAHKGLLWGMYVRPSARKTGVGRRLVEAIIELARPRIELIQLAVGRDNEPARRLYSSLGFVEYGIEINAHKQNGLYVDEVLMARDLRANSI